MTERNIIFSDYCKFNKLTIDSTTCLLIDDTLIHLENQGIDLTKIYKDNEFMNELCLLCFNYNLDITYGIIYEDCKEIIDELKRKFDFSKYK